MEKTINLLGEGPSEVVSQKQNEVKALQAELASANAHLFKANTEIANLAAELTALSSKHSAVVWVKAFPSTVGYYWMYTHGCMGIVEIRPSILDERLVPAFVLWLGGQPSMKLTTDRADYDWWSATPIAIPDAPDDKKP